MNNLFIIVQRTVLGIAVGIAIGILEDLGLGIMLSMAFGIVGVIGVRTDISIGITEAAIIGLLGGSIKGQEWGIQAGLKGCFVAAFTWCVASALTTGKIDSGIFNNFVSLTVVFFITYIVGYYRLPLYPISSLSTLQAYESSKKNPPQVSEYLSKSSLYWDELVFLPLPFLRKTILIAEKQNRAAAQKEIGFITTNRSHQSSVALSALREIALNDMKLCDNIYDISIAALQLENLNIFNKEDNMVSKKWIDPFSHLRDASREASSYYYNSKKSLFKRKALQSMLNYLNTIYPTFPEAHLNTLLKEIIIKWEAIARTEQDKLGQEAEIIGQIENPYKPNLILEPNDHSLFVGRRDIVDDLNELLRKENNRIVFILNGERRMGKSSTLKQLPRLLGASYIPIFYDLQRPSMYSRIDIFLSKISEGIYESLRSTDVTKLDQKYLSEALSLNEANIYYIFDKWLDSLDIILKQEGRTILLLFDEFEKLQEIGHTFLNLNLLLDWFRSTIQNPKRSHIAMLFSGVKAFEDMGPNWAKYFVSTKILKVSFLHPSDATHLILNPTNNFRGKDIFSQDVVEAILHMTGCHPFLVQALCSELIRLLNNENLEKAEIHHIATAANEAMERYEGYFFELWKDSEYLHQQACLKILCQEGTSIDTIVSKTELSEQDVRLTLKILLKRDLILQEQNTYRISMPILRTWIERK